MSAQSANRRRTLAIVTTLVLVVSFGVPVVANVTATPTGAAGSLPGAAPAATPSETTAAPSQVPTSPHPGVLEVYDVYPGGATTEDPAVAYDTVSYEPILNVFETLVAFNGSGSNGLGPNAFVPVLATCVPGTAQCAADYGQSLIVSNGAGLPVYWTFVIDPAAKFYDPATTTSWGVYPTDVMFSIAREMAYSEAIGVGNTPGWLIAQALLPNGSGSFDGGVHAPYNTTPADILGSMLINDTNYCPAAAMTSAHGCITFVADGGGGPWPQFLQLIGDGFMGVLPCGWYSNAAQGAGVPGWAAPASADSSCLLPNGGTTTQSSLWTSYLAGLNPTSWDAFEENLGATYPAPAPNVQWNMVGSGPYYSIVTPTSSPPGYSLLTNPAYTQPGGCSGAGGLMTYGGYCWPAPGSYEGRVVVIYESSDIPGINFYKAGQADFAQFLLSDTSEMLKLASLGKLDYYVAHGLDTYFQMPDLNYSKSAYTTDGLPGSPNIPHDFFSGAAARALMTTAVPYTTVENEANTVDGVQYYFLGGGPIPAGMDYYPTNVSYPETYGNSGPSAYWWHVGTTVGSGYYDPELAACLNTTCVFPIVGELGAVSVDAIIALEITAIEAATGGHVQPFTYDLSYSCFPIPSPFCFGVGPGTNPLPYWNLGWAADDFDPQDYLIPLAYPDSTFTYQDAVYEQFNLPEYHQTSVCGHSTGTLPNLIYWAKQPGLNSSCEGVAYDVANDFFLNASHQFNTPQDAVLYWAIQAILNNLNLYTWDGQGNTVITTAPWIDGGTVNLNALIGGGYDQFWFQIRYVPYETPVTFTEKGLPSPSMTFTVTAGSPAASVPSNNTTGTATFYEPNGTLTYSFTPPAGYAVTKVTGPKRTTTSSTTVAGSPKGTALTVVFVPVNTLSFTETGLAPGTVWDVNITWASNKSGPPNGDPTVASFSRTTSVGPSGAGGSINFSVAKGPWKFVVSVPAHYKVSVAKGSVGANRAATVKALKFSLVTSRITFSERGLAKGTTWTVNVTGPNGTCSASGAQASLLCMLVSGTYTVTVSPVAGYTLGSYPTTLTVIAPKGQAERFTYTKP